MPQSIAMTSAQSATAAAELDGEDKSWQDMANCLGVDPDLFFPERGASTREAKEVCKGCVVRDDCLEYALANGEKFGIWGGMSERERRRIQEEEERAHAEAEKKAEEENRKRLEDEKKAEYDELLAYAVEFVESNPKVVSGIFKEWLANDAAKTNEANVAASGAA